MRPHESLPAAARRRMMGTKKSPGCLRCAKSGNGNALLLFSDRYLRRHHAAGGSCQSVKLAKDSSAMLLQRDGRPHLTSTAWRLMHSAAGQGQEADNTKVRPAPTPHVKAAFPISVGHGCSRLCRVSRSASHAKRDAKSFPVTKSFPVVKGSLPGRSRLARARASHCSRAGPILSLRERRSESRLTE